MTTATSVEYVSARIDKLLADHVGERKHRMWFEKTARIEYHESADQLDVATPNRFVADWIERHFTDALRHAAAQELGHDVTLRIFVDAERFAHVVTPDHARPDRAPDTFVTTVPRRRKLPAESQTYRHTLDEFIVGPNNELAFVSANRLVDEDGKRCNPVFIHGGCGLGKTHLLQGICRRMRERRPEANVLYTTAEQFTNEFLNAMRHNKIEQFRRRIRRLDLLAVDDVHFLANKQATQQEFLHSFDAIDLGGARVALASDSHPRLIQQFSDALVSRCLSGMVVEIKPPDSQTRIKIIKALAMRRHINLLDTVVEALARSCRGSVREIEGTITKLHALASLVDEYRDDNAAGNVATATGTTTIGHAVLNRLLTSEMQSRPQRPVRFETILNVIVDQLQVTRAQVLNGNRQRHNVLARSLVIFITREMTTMSYPEIADAMHRPTHSTIITAAQRVQKQIDDNVTVLLPGTLGQMGIRDIIEQLKDAIVRAA